MLNINKLSKYIKKKKQQKYIEKEQAENNRHFEDFRDRYISSTPDTYSYIDLKNKMVEVDALIVGSDQVWNNWFKNCTRNVNQINTYFLNFGSKKTKRISYAASWGTTTLPTEFINMARDLLHRFDYVSVREKSGVELCSECGRDDAEWVCDPTFLLKPNIYRKLIEENDIRKQEKPFIMLYMLNNECDFNFQTVYEYAEEKNLNVVYVTGNGVIDSYDKFFASVPEWLYLIDNAEYVITNSFHCAVFSTIFNKQFGVVPLTGAFEGMNSRFESLFELLGIDARYLKNGDFSVLNKFYEPKIIAVSQRFLDVLNC